MLPSDSPPTLQEVLAGSNRGVEERQLEAKIPRLRLDAMKASALSYGTQAGLARRTYEIRQTIEARASQLNRIYDFCGLMLERSVIPPVLAESRGTVQVTGPDLLRVSDATYQIVAQARFSTACPSWRDYLITGVTFQMPDNDVTLAPRDADEQRFWQAQVSQGWTAGVQQADQVFQAELARLDRDYKGMVLYRHLLTQRMVSLPFVAESNLGVTGDGNRLTINDRVLRITAMPQLETRTDQWRAPLLPLPVGSTGQP